MRIRLLVATLLLSATMAEAAHQDWAVTHQGDRFKDRVMMEAWADADSGPARLMLYCDTDNGFRVMFLPHRKLLGEGPAQVLLTIDNDKPLLLGGDAFGDDDTDVVTVHDTAKIQKALSRARRVSAHFEGFGAGNDSFTFGDLAADRATLMKVCPLQK
jgi:hypothetical protein